MSVRDLTEQDLIIQCRDETNKFLRDEDDDTQYCFEIFRRLLVDGQMDLVAPLMDTYGAMMENWTTSHGAFENSGLEGSELVGSTFAKLIQKCSGDKFDDFDNVASILAWMKRVLINSLIDIVRRMKQPPSNQMDDIGEVRVEAKQPPISSNIEQEELWQCICRILGNDVDIQIARHNFVESLKPGMIAEQMDMTSHQVSSRLYRIRIKLKDRIEECN